MNEKNQMEQSTKYKVKNFITAFLKSFFSLMVFSIVVFVVMVLILMAAS